MSPFFSPTGRAFSLVEVVMALGICSFALISVIGLFTAGLLINRESEGRIGAVNLAEKILEMRRISPVSATNQMANLAIPVLNRPYGPAYLNGGSSTSYITASGYLTNSPGFDTYMATCQAGTNSLTGEKVAQVYLMLSWPAQQNPSNPQAFRYETLTYIPLR
ncbi:MAG: hypothetical protein B9S32_14780 [Verrucomicrobia bacterium Tous-C9LFEB]|nr:MAG: hypothetical protein B9S32_14780 [Verrucomicrobia bacterium Tous-C9LFEB]